MCECERLGNTEERLVRAESKGMRDHCDDSRRDDSECGESTVVSFDTESQLRSDREAKRLNDYHEVSQVGS